jgi:hypothetical protein
VTTRLVLDLLVAASVLASSATVPRALARRRQQGEWDGRRIGPGVALFAVVVLIYLNQVAFTVYVTAVHGGDASFIGRYLPDGWFSLLEADHPVVALASAFPRPELLAPSLLRTFIASTAALGHLVLVVYETALLYNLATLSSHLAGATGGVVVLTAARFVDARTQAVAPSFGAVATAGSLLRWFVALFLVPALAIRYGVTFGSAASALAGALLIALAAAALTVRGRTLGGRPLLVSTQLLAAAAAGLAVAYAVTLVLPGGYYESTLLWSLAAFLLTAVAVSAVADRHLRSVGMQADTG